ncbi:MAG: hypothetical protein QXI19_07710, partial [Candidatus Caldarchaeum sp.]
MKGKWYLLMRCFIKGHLCVSLAFFYFVFAFAQEQKHIEIDRNSILQAVEKLSSALNEWVEKLRGEGKGSLHLVFGFSTGHFDTAPVSADAARQIAAEYGSQVLRHGDEVSV